MKAHDSGHFEKDRKKLRLADFDDVDKALVVQPSTKQARPTLRTYSTGEGDGDSGKKGHSNFSGSTGWLDRFKLRHGIVFKNVCGESASVCTTSTDSWKETHLQRILKNYDPKVLMRRGCSTDVFHLARWRRKGKPVLVTRFPKTGSRSWLQRT